MMKFTDLIERVKARAASVGVRSTEALRHGEIDYDYLGLLFVQELGFHIDDSGTICDPRPTPSPAAMQHTSRYHRRGGRR